MWLLADLRHAFRLIGRSRAFSLSVIATLALGIGADTTAFSFVSGVLLRPLPYPGAERLVRLSEEHPGATAAMRAAWLSNLTYHAWSEAPRTLEGIAAYGGRLLTIDGPEPERLEAAAVSPALFTLLGARPAAGRFFRPEDAAENAPPVVVLSHGLWRQRFDADPNVVGRSLAIEGRGHEVVGVAAPGFYFPDRDTRLWTPFTVSRPGDPNARPISVFFALGRLKPGATAARAEAEGTAAARGAGPRPQAAELLFGKGGPVTVKVRSLSDALTSEVRPALAVLAAGAGLLLLIACANVAHLFLSRGLARRRELVVRAALGAGRGRVVRQLLVECLTLTAIGGLAGLALAAAATAAAPALTPRDFPRLDDVHIDPATIAFAALATLLSGVLAGLPAALRSTRGPLAQGGPWSSEASFGGAGAGPSRGALLVTQSALAVMLLVGSGLLIRSFARLVQVDAGYDATNVLIARVHLPGTDTAPERTQTTLDGLLERLRAQPGVRHAGAGNMAPFEDSAFVAGFDLPERETGGKPTRARALQHQVTAGYAEALGLRLVEGRFLGAKDVAGAERAILVNREFARQFLSDGPVAGRRLPNVQTRGPELTEIVGVVGDVLKDGLDGKPQPEIYTLAQPGRPFRRDASVVIRAAGDPLALVPDLRRLLREVGATAALDQVGTLAQRVRASVSQPRFATTVLATFAVIALALAAIGVYAVLSYAVTQRRRELGVRAALGATRRDLVELVLKQGLGFTLAGLALGLAGAAALARLMSDLLFGVTPTDALAFGLAPVPLLLAAGAACLLPARRAADADPAEVLRSE
jgi:predicted permease